MRRLMLWLEPSLPKNTWVAKVLSMSSGGADIFESSAADGEAVKNTVRENGMVSFDG